MSLEEEFVWEHWAISLYSTVGISCHVTETNLLYGVSDCGEFFADELDNTLCWLDEVLEWVSEPVPVWIFGPRWIFYHEGLGPDGDEIGRVFTTSEELKTHAWSKWSLMICSWFPSRGQSNKTIGGSLEDTGERMISAADELNFTNNTDWVNWLDPGIEEWESLFNKDVTLGVKGWLH